MLPHIDNLHENFKGDWLELLSVDINEKWNLKQLKGDPFERYIQLFLKYGYPEHHILPKLSSSCQLATTTLDIMQKSCIVKILRDTRGIFEYITDNECTVWFVIPFHGRLADILDEVAVENLSFTNMLTCIQFNGSELDQKYLWTDTSDPIKDLLVVSFQLAMAYHIRQPVVYLERLQEIGCHQMFHASSNAIVHQFAGSALKNHNWNSKNFLQRIIDVCVNSGITAVIDFPNDVYLHPSNAYLVSGFKRQDEVTGQESGWRLEILNGQEYSLKYLINCITKGMKKKP